MFTKRKHRASYPIDVEAFLFTPDSSNSWEISGFRKTMKEEEKGDGQSFADQCRGAAMSGINTPHIMIGMAGRMTSFHVEDHIFASVNYNPSGGPKHWVVIPSPHAEKARALFKKLYPQDYVKCQSCDLEVWL